jgi:peptidoglycan/LPS O-acetylase OafA/YrhL
MAYSAVREMYLTHETVPKASNTDRKGPNATTLDILRWGSAWLVAAGHARNLLFLDYYEIDSPSFVAKIFYFATGLGHEAVLVFFVLSGYLVGGKLLLEKIKPATLIDYFSHRFCRIYIVLFPALLLTLAVDLLGEKLPRSDSLYRSPHWAASLDFVTVDRHGFDVLLCNVLNLQDAVCPPFGSNGPLWSLAYEWFYYVTFPVVIIVATRIREKHSLLVVAALLFTTLLYIAPNYVSYYPIWAMGAFARFVQIQGRNAAKLRYLGLVMLAAILISDRVLHFDGFGMDLMAGIAASLVLASSPTLAFGKVNAKFHAFLAGFSYSLYVTHFPVMVFATALLLSAGVISDRQTPDLKTFEIFLATLAVVLLMAWMFSVATERHTEAVRARMSFAIKRIFDPAAPTATVD